MTKIIHLNVSVERKTKMNVTVNHNKSEGKSLKGYEQRVHYKKP